MFVFLAHGALGVFDEIFLLLALAIFLIMLVVPSAVALLRKGRGGTVSTPDKPMPGGETPERDHFRLD